jgi:hypothetical protein
LWRLFSAYLFTLHACFAPCFHPILPVDGAVSLSLKRTENEQAANIAVSSMSIIPTSLNDSSTAISISLLQYNAKLLNVNSSSKYSNIIQTSFSAGDSTVVIQLANTMGKVGPSRSTTFAVNFTTKCHSGDYGKYNVTCPGSNKLLIHRCHGFVGTLVSYCPIMATVCNSVNMTSGEPLPSSVNGYNCHLSQMTTEMLTCTCIPVTRRRLQETESSYSRRLATDETLQKSGVLSAAAMAQYTAYEVGETFKAAPMLTSPQAIERALIVIAMFVVLWAGGLSLMCGCFIRQRQLRHEALERKLDSATQTHKAIA